MKIKWPVDNYKAIFQFFGENADFYKKLTGIAGHTGIDWSIVEGSNVYAVADGEVYLVDYPIYGKRICINHDAGGGAVYGHLSEQLVKVGDKVKAGQLIAKSGNTGYPKYSTGPHLHLGVWINGDKDPKLNDMTDYLGYFFEGDIEDNGKAYRIENGRKRWWPDRLTSLAHGLLDVSIIQKFIQEYGAYKGRWGEVPKRIRDGEWMQFKDGRNYEVLQQARNEKIIKI